MKFYKKTSTDKYSTDNHLKKNLDYFLANFLKLKTSKKTETVENQQVNKVKP